MRDRFADEESTRAILIQAAIVSVLAGGKALQKAIKDLRGDGDE